MKAWLKFALTWYLISWIVSYAILMRGNFAYVLTYFKYGWFGGGEIPGMIQVFAFVLTFLALLVRLVWRITRKAPSRTKHPVGAGSKNSSSSREEDRAGE